MKKNMLERNIKMKRRFMFYIALLVPALLLSGCSLNTFDDSDRILASDKSVSKDDLARVTSHLLNTVPDVRAEKARLAQGGKKVKLVLNILSAPERAYTRNDPGYMSQVNYYEVYVSYSDKDVLLKYDTYRVHHDLLDVLRYDSEKDDFLKVSP